MPAFNCSGKVFPMDMLAENRLTFRQGLAVQPFAMVSGKQVGRYQNVPKESHTHGHSVRIVWQFEAQKKSVFVSVVSVQAIDKKTGVFISIRRIIVTIYCTTVPGMYCNLSRGHDPKVEGVI